MSSKLSLFLCVILGLITNRSLWADSVQLKNGETRFGLIISETQNEVTLQFKRAGRLQTALISKTEIEALIRTIDATRLANLTPEQPSGYRDYAEELAAYTHDPAAIDLATRLFLLAAYWGEGKIRTSGFLGLISLAPDRAAEKRIRCLAYQSDRQPDPLWLQMPTPEPETPTPAIESDLVFSCVQSVRSLDFARARSQFQQLDPNKHSDSTKKVVQILQEIITREQATHRQLYLLLEWELTKRGAAAADNSLSELLESNRPDLRECRFDNVTPFDPRFCFYRGGQWTEK